MTSDKSFIAHRDLNADPKLVLKAKDQYLYFTDKRVLDACGGAAVVSVGHCNPLIYTSILKQMEKVAYIHTGEFNTEATEEFGDSLLKGYEDKLGKAYIVNSGTEANNAALKLSIQYFRELGIEGKTEFISRNQSYHGNCLGGLSLSGHVERRKGFEEILNPHMHKVSPAFEYRYRTQNETTEMYVERLAKELEDKIVEIGPEKVAAFFAETVVGATTGCVSAPPGYFKAVREVCEKYNVLLVLDEIMCGAGRTGTFFAWEQEGIVPDIVTIGKALSSGYAPLAACIFSTKVTNALKNGSGKFRNGHTYQAFPLACNAGTAVLSYIRENNLLQNVKEMGEYLRSELKRQLSPLSIVGDVRGRGLFWGVEFVKDKETKEMFDPSLAVGYLVKEAAFENGVSIYPGGGTFDGAHGDHILIAPMYTSTKEDIDLIVEQMKLSIIQVQKKVSD